MIAELVCYLSTARKALSWKLDGLGEYDLRRPLVATGCSCLYRLVSALSAATVAALSRSAVGQVPGWPTEGYEVTLHRSCCT